MNNGWIKTTLDCDKIYGSDELVKSKQISWSKTPTRLSAVQIYHNDKSVITIAGVGEYNYSEDYELVVPYGSSKLLSRRLQFYCTDKPWAYGSNYNKYTNITILHSDKRPSGNFDILQTLPSGWFTIEYDVSNDCTFLSMENNKI